MMLLHLVTDPYVSYGVWEAGEEWASDIQSAYVRFDILKVYSLGMIVKSLWLHPLPASCSLSTWQ